MRLPKSTLCFYKRVNVPLFSTKARLFDLADELMLFWHGTTRTIYLGLRIEDPKWKRWNIENVQRIEQLIRDDLRFDGYYTTMKRLGRLGTRCTAEFRWKLLIRTI